MLTKKEPAAHFYAPVSTNHRFTFGNLQLQRKDVVVSRSDKLDGNTVVKRIPMFVLDENEAGGVIDHAVEGWVVQNPDESFWWDSLEQTKSACESWLSEGQARMRDLGLKVARVEFRVPFVKTLAMHA